MNETIYCKTIEVGRCGDCTIFASARTVRSASIGSIDFIGAAWAGNGATGDWLPPRKLQTNPTISEARAQAWARIEADAWFGTVRDEIWRLAHPSSAPALPTEAP